jgi:hypothetical protein
MTFGMQRYDQPALRAFFCLRMGLLRNGNRASSHDLAKILANKVQQIGQIAKFPRCPVFKNNCYNFFCHFHLILSVNIGLDQQLLIYHTGQF